MGDTDGGIVPFDPQDNPTLGLVFGAMEKDKSIPKDVIQRMRGVLEAEITGDGNGVTIKSSNVKQVQHNTMDRTLKQYDVVAVKGVDRYYKRMINPSTGEPIEDVYTPTDKEDLVNIITHYYEKETGTVDGAAIDKIWNSLDKKIRKDNTIDKVDNTIIQLLPNSNSFWNTENGDVTDHIPEGYKCFRRLFDTAKETKHIVKYPEGAFDNYAGILKEYIGETYAELILNKGDLEEDDDFKFIQTVACNDHERYLEIIRMFATFFMKNKPLGTYILEGNGRNGKSGIIGLIHTLMGSRNTSKLQLAELGNWHKNHCLINTLVNAPDEEKPGTLEDTDLFRVIADHGDIELDVMRGQQPIEISCDFQCVSASNHLPNWEGNDAEACIRRARIIPFMADLSGNDNKNESFEKITYTPERMVHFLGVVLGTAKYYMTRDFPVSASAETMKEILQENMVSYRLYYTSFIKYFGRYHKLREVYDDYVLWCKDKGYKINKYDEFKEAFNDSRGKKTSYSDNVVELNVVYRVGPADLCFYEDWTCPEAKMYGTISQMHDAGVSILTVLEGLTEQQMKDGIGGYNG